MKSAFVHKIGLSFFLTLLIVSLAIYLLRDNQSVSSITSGKAKATPNDWMGRQKLYPNSKFSHAHYLHALKQAEVLHRHSPAYRAAWEPAGPENVGGRITDIGIHPSNPSTR